MIYKFKQLEYMEDVNSLSLKMTEHITEKLKEHLGEEFLLTDAEENKVWNLLQELLEKRSITGDYKHHM